MTARLRRTAAIVAGLALAGIITVPASASARLSTNGVTRFAVSPSRSLISYSPKVQVIPFRIENVGTTAITITARIMQGRQLRDGASVFSAPQPGSGVAWFLSLPSQFRIRPGQTVTRTASLRIPRSAQGSGQHYLAVFFYRQDPAKDGHIGVSVQAGIDAELIIDTGGKPRHGARWALSAPSLSWGGSVPLTLTVHNTGNVLLLNNHLSASVHGSRIAFPGVLALAGSTRTVTTQWAAPSLCLPCRASIAGASATVWRIPGLGLAGLVVLVVACVLAGVLLRTRHRKARSRRHGRAKPGFGPVAGQEGGIIDSR